MSLKTGTSSEFRDLFLDTRLKSENHDSVPLASLLRLQTGKTHLPRSPQFTERHGVVTFNFEFQTTRWLVPSGGFGKADSLLPTHRVVFIKVYPFLVEIPHVHQPVLHLLHCPNLLASPFTANLNGRLAQHHVTLLKRFFLKK